MGEHSGNVCHSLCGGDDPVQGAWAAVLCGARRIGRRQPRRASGELPPDPGVRRARAIRPARSFRTADRGLAGSGTDCAGLRPSPLPTEERGEHALDGRLLTADRSRVVGTWPAGTLDREGPPPRGRGRSTEYDSSRGAPRITACRDGPRRASDRLGPSYARLQASCPDSSVGQSNGLLIRRSQVRILLGVFLRRADPPGGHRLGRSMRQAQRNTALQRCVSTASAVSRRAASRPAPVAMASSAVTNAADGFVSFDDLLVVLANFGDCP